MGITGQQRRGVQTVATLALVAACSTTNPTRSLPTPTPPPTQATTAATPTTPVVAGGAGITKVLTVVEENHGQSSALSGMPYLATMARTYGQTTAYRTLSHPSLPNYLAMAGGSTFDVHDDASPARHPLAGRSVFDVTAPHTARTYAEDMPTPCATSPQGRYAVKHNPWPYFSDPASRSACQQGDLPSGTPTSGALHDDVVQGTLPTVGLLVPDLCHDAHDCSLATADTWLKGWLTTVLSGPDYRAGHLAVVVTFDENEGSDTGSILTVVIAPTLHARTVSAPLSHLAWARWMTDLTGSAPLRLAATAPSLGRAFGL